MLVREFFAKNKTIIMPQPPYSPDLAPVDIFLFPKLKTSMKGKRFATIEEIKEKSKQELLTIPKRRISEVFRALEKNVLYGINKYFWKKLKITVIF